MPMAPAVGASAPMQAPTIQGRARARALGIRVGELAPGPLNAITDVAGVRVGHTTIIKGEGAASRGSGPRAPA